MLARDFDGERAGVRTLDLLIKSQLLYRLSYTLPRADRPGKCAEHKEVVLVGQLQKCPARLHVAIAGTKRPKARLQKIIRGERTTMNTADFHEPIHILEERGETTIASASEAYAALTGDWPPSRGKWYHAAARACRSASIGETSPHIARRMFIHAAGEARLPTR